MQNLRTILIAATVYLLGGCSSTKIISSWKAPGELPVAPEKILVLGLINDPDRSIREQMETHIMNDLRALGYDAVCSCEEYSPKEFEHLSEKEALDKLWNGGIRAVLTIVLLDKQKEYYYVPGRISNYPASPAYKNFWSYYSNMYGRVYSTGYYVTDTKYFWESNFYNLSETSAALYSAQSQSFDPENTGKMSHEYGQLIIKDMLKNNILADKKKVILKPM